MNIQFLVILLLIAFIGYRMYQRVRRTFVWQELKPGKLRFKTILFSVIGTIFFAEGVFLAGGGQQAIGLLSSLAGIAFGVVLAYYSAGTTNFERRGASVFYRANAWIGGFVTVLFLGRLIYRFYGLLQPGGDPSSMTWSERMGGTGNAWMSGLILIMFAYYVTYNLLLMRKQRTGNMALG